MSQLPRKCLPAVEYSDIIFEMIYTFLVKPQLVMKFWPLTTIIFFRVNIWEHILLTLNLYSQGKIFGNLLSF